LKRLSDAVRDCDNILAVIKGSFVNQDGASSGLTVPNGVAQEQVITKALQRAGLRGSDIDYIEAHGTGTSLGDPIEVGAISKVIVKDRDRPLIIGSAKTNIGHLEPSAGIAGIIKIILSMQNQTIPKHLHFKELNPLINLDGIVLPLENMEWKKGDRIRRAGISSFGFTGTNAHVIIEEAPNQEILHAEEREQYLFVISAKTEKALSEQVANYINYLKSTNDKFSDIVYTSSVGRSHFKYRVALIVSSKDEAIEQLKNYTFAVSGANPRKIHDEQNLENLQKLYLEGRTLDWSSIYKSGKKVSLPTYPFQRQRYTKSHK